MEYTEKEWIRINIDIRRENIAYNIKIIRALWKLKYRSYGERVIESNKHNPSNLFGTLEKSQETLRQWEMQQVDLKMEKIFKWAEKIEQKTDIPGEYLSGQEMINLSVVGGGGSTEYLKFWKEYENLYDLIRELRDNERIGISNLKTNVNEEEANRMTLTEIESYLMNLGDKIKSEFIKTVNEAKQSIKVIKEYNSNLDNVLNKLLVDEFEKMLFNKDRKLYRLIFFIYRGKKCGSGQSIMELIRVLNDKHADEMAGVGEEVLFNYIVALKKQLKLAEATYIIATDTRKFNNEKNYKKIIN